MIQKLSIIYARAFSGLFSNVSQSISISNSILCFFSLGKMAEVDVVRSLQECLVEFSGMNLRLEQKLIKCGCIHLVLGELYSIREFEKIQHVSKIFF